MCTSPITITVEGKHFGSRAGGILVPCGKCCECLAKYQNSWLFRMVSEFSVHNCASFLTLTYSNENIPFYLDSDTGEMYKTVYIKHVQDCLKRFRINHLRASGEKLEFKYFCTSEYGPRTLRPHYHMLIWGLDVRQLKEFIDDWESRHGFVRARNVKYHRTDFYKTARYVSKYCSKGVFENPLVKLNCVNKCTKLISKGIGESYLSLNRVYHLCYREYPTRASRMESDGLHYKDEYLKEVVNRFIVPIVGSKYPYSLPRYYKVKLYGKNISLQTQISNFLFRTNADLDEQELCQIQADHPDWSYGEAIAYKYRREADGKRQREKDLRQTLAKFYDKSKL